MIGEILKYMREKSGLNQQEIAKLLSLKQSTISGYETNFSPPNFETVKKIADICDYEIAFIDKDSGEKITPE